MCITVYVYNNQSQKWDLSFAKFRQLTKQLRLNHENK